MKRRLAKKILKKSVFLRNPLEGLNLSNQLLTYKKGTVARAVQTMNRVNKPKPKVVVESEIDPEKPTRGKTNRKKHETRRSQD